MKRSEEVAIIIDALVKNGLLQENKTDRARCVIKEAIKYIRCERYREKQTKNCLEGLDETGITIMEAFATGCNSGYKDGSEEKLENVHTERLVKEYLLAILKKAASVHATPEEVEVAPRVAEILLDIN